MHSVGDDFANRVGENLDCAPVGYDNPQFGSWLLKF
jgi:hypothetical protein